MPFSFPKIDFGALHRFRRQRERRHQHLFSKKQWILLAVVGVLAMVLSVGASLGWIALRNRHRLKTEEEQTALFKGDESHFGFLSQQLVIPEAMQAKRKPKVDAFRAFRPSWSEAQVLGTPESHWWTDPADISADRLEAKNNQWIEDFFAQTD